MTPDGAFDRRLTTWLEEDAAPRAPQGFDDVVAETVNQKRQLPSWATPERWISMETRAQFGVMPRAVILLLTIWLLVAALAASLALAGKLTLADDGGGIAGLTYSTGGVIYQHPTDAAGEPVPLTDESEYATTFAWSPDGTRFFYESWVSPEGPMMIVVRDADGSNPVVITEPYEPTPRGLRPDDHVWSPDGSRILYRADGPDAAGALVPLGHPCRLNSTFCGQRIWIAPTDGSEPARVIGDPELDARAPVWTPDGESIIFVGSAAGSGTDYGIYRMDAEGENVERIGDLTGDGDFFDEVAISPDGTTVGVTVGSDASDRGDVYLVDLATGEDVLIVVDENSEWVHEAGPRWSPDGSMIAFTRETDAPQAMLYDVASGEVFALGVPVGVLGWSPDGRYIFGQWPDGVMTVVDVTDPTAPVATQVDLAAQALAEGTHQPLAALGWSPDSRYIFGHWPGGIMTVVDVTDPTAPVATQVDEFPEIDEAGWQPRP